jgi:hypothetical protein
MDRKIDMSKVEAALKRAGETALRGSREERNGRFTAIDAAKKPKTFIETIKKKK